MTTPLYSIPTAARRRPRRPHRWFPWPTSADGARTVAEVLEASSQIEAVMDELDARPRSASSTGQAAASATSPRCCVIDKLRTNLGLQSAQSPSLHMCFTGNPGTGKTTVAMRMAADPASASAMCAKAILVAVTRDDLVGQYIGHTAPKTKEVVKKAMGGVLFIDEAYYLYKPENERDYGQESIEILLQTMENHRDDLVVVLAGYKDRMDRFFSSNPGMASRIAHHIDFPDYSEAELMQIAQLMLGQLNYAFDDGATTAFARYVGLRRQQPHFANARSVRNALDRIRLRHATRLFAAGSAPTREQLCTLQAEDILASRVFGQAAAPQAAGAGDGH